MSIHWTRPGLTNQPVQHMNKPTMVQERIQRELNKSQHKLLLLPMATLTKALHNDLESYGPLANQKMSKLHLERAATAGEELFQGVAAGIISAYIKKVMKATTLTDKANQITACKKLLKDAKVKPCGEVTRKLNNM